MINPFRFVTDYSISLTDEDLEELESKGDNLFFYNICVVRDNIKDSTVNLKCPIIVNVDNRLAKQVILEDSKYPLRFPFSEFSKGGI